LQCYAAASLWDAVQEYQETQDTRLVEVWSRTLLTLLSMIGEYICVRVFAQMADISNIYCQQLHN